MPKPWRPALERFTECYAVDPDTGCWIWQRQTGAYGYGVFSLGKEYGDPKKQMGAHRAAWVLCRGAILPGYQIDHICRVRSCVNPSHLRMVSQRDNVLNSDGLSARAARRIHCRHGHEYTEANMYRDSAGARRCRRCNIERAQRHAKRYQAGLGPAPDLQDRIAALEQENAELRARLAQYEQP